MFLNVKLRIFLNIYASTSRDSEDLENSLCSRTRLKINIVKLRLQTVMEISAQEDFQKSRLWSRIIMKSTNAGQSSKKAEREHSARYQHSVPTHQPTEGDADSLYTAGDQCVIMQSVDVLSVTAGQQSCCR